ncbi:MAG: alanine--glyoxylate aminotransferase family protein [Candidatus Omnitrophota bacterium]|nr:alanine--glyoxylate aminotransferase family protein [Candidatus Omnitrophota bacterium]
MTREPLLLTPGPTIVPPSVLEALGRPTDHHRTKEFQAVLKEVGEGLKKVFGTAQEVLILTSSGTGAMEAAVANLLSAGDEAIVIRGGKFGERWGEICEAFGATFTPVDPLWGKPLDLKALEQTLKQHPRAKAVFATLCETSAGVVFDIRGLRRAITAAGVPALLVVDAISGLGADSFAMDEMGVDVAVSGSQKGFMLPPGLAFIALSPRAWEAVSKSKSPRYYYDLNLAKKAWADTDTPWTPAISLIIGLKESLKIMLAKGIESFTAGHRADAEKLRADVQKMGLELYADPACASNAVTMIKVPAGVDGKELLKQIRAKHNIVIAGGQGKELVGKVIRIATMGAVGPAEIQAGLNAVEEVLAEMQVKNG